MLQIRLIRNSAHFKFESLQTISKRTYDEFCSYIWVTGWCVRNLQSAGMGLASPAGAFKPVLSLLGRRERTSLKAPAGDARHKVRTVLGWESLCKNCLSISFCLDQKIWTVKLMLLILFLLKIHLSVTETTECHDMCWKFFIFYLTSRLLKSRLARKLIKILNILFESLNLMFQFEIRRFKTEVHYTRNILQKYSMRRSTMTHQ